MTDSNINIYMKLKRLSLLVIFFTFAILAHSQSKESDELFQSALNKYNDGEYNKSLSEFKQVHDMDSRDYPEDFELLFNNSHCIAHLLCKLGKTDEAKIYDSSFYELPPVDRSLIKKSSEYSNFSANSPSLDMAIFWAKKCVEEEINNLGEDNFMVFGSYCTLASLYYQAGDEKECRKYIKLAKNAADGLPVTTTSWMAMPYSLEATLEMMVGVDEANYYNAFEMAWKYLDGDILSYPAVYSQCLQMYINNNSNGDSGAVNNEVERAKNVISVAEDDVQKNCVEVVRTISQFAVSSNQPSLGLNLTKHLIDITDATDPVYSFLLYDYGRLLKVKGFYEEGADYLKQSLAIQKRMYPDAKDQWVDVIFSLGYCYDSMREYKLAEEMFKEAGKIYKKSDNMPMYIQALYQLGALSTRTNDFKSAINYLNECLSKMEKIGADYKGDLAYMYSEMAVCYSSLDKSKSIELYKKAISILGTPETVYDKNTYISCRTAIMQAESNPDQIEDEARDILMVINKDGMSSPELIKKVYTFLSNYFLGRLDFEKSIKYSDEIIALGKNFPDMNMFDGYSTKCIALVNLKRGDEAWKMADEIYESTLKEFGEYSSPHLNSIQLYIFMAENTFSMERLMKLPEMSATFVNYANQLSKNDPAYLYYKVEGGKCLSYSDPMKAAEIISEALKNIPPRIYNTDVTSVMNAHLILSYIERNVGNLDKALYYSNLCMEALPLISDPIPFVTVSDEIGQTLMLSGKMKDAEQIFLNAIEKIESQNTDMMHLALLYDHIATVYEKMGQNNVASEYRAKRNVLYARWDDNNVIDAQYKLTNLWSKYNLGQKEECFADIEALEKFVNENSHMLDLTLPAKLKSIYYYREGDYDEATRYIDEVLAKNKNIETLNIATEIYGASGDLQKALVSANDLLKQVTTYYRGNAMEYCGPHKRLGDIYLAMGNKDESLNNYRKCFDYSVNYIDDNLLTLNSKQRADFWNSNSNFYFCYLPYVAYKNDFPETFYDLLYDSALFSNGLLLTADKTISKLIDKTTPAIKELFSSYSAKKDVLQKMTDNFNQTWLGLAGNISEEQFSSYSNEQEKVETARDECEAVERQLMSELREKYPQLLNYRSYKWKDVQKNLPSHAAAIEYLDFPIDSENNTIAALVIKKGCKNPAFRVLMTYPRNKKFGIDELYQSTAVADSLINGLADLLEDCDDVYFAPQGLLCSIGLESMPRTQIASTQNLNLYRVSSTRVLAEKKPRRKDFNASLFGGLNYDTSIESLQLDAEKYPELRNRAFVSDNLFRANREGDVEIPPLPGTLQEVNNIYAFLNSGKNSHPILKVGNEGTETAFKALSGKYGSILHVSTHGFFNADNIIVNPNIDVLSYEDIALEQAGLLMAGASHRYVNEEEIPDNIDDGILKASEISKLNMEDVDLVVLSACETGLGTITGDGVFGLQRGFKKAGANSILMSLWKVDDDATSAFMSEFYKQWTGGKSKHDSYEIAKSHIKSQSKWSKPEYWAAFILLDGIN